jgi:hypothetical protein
VHKFAFKEECNKCGSKKTDEAVAEVDAMIKKNEDAGLPEGFRPGDWMCPNCKGHIYARHDTCNKCDNTTLKPTDGSDWGTFMNPAAAASTSDSAGSAAAAPAEGDTGDATAVAPDEEPVVAEAS